MLSTMSKRTDTNYKCILFIFSSLFFCIGAQTYQEATKLFTDKLSSTSGYNTAVRPLQDQSQVIEIEISFEILALVEIDAIKQQFTINGILSLSWQDELIAWNPSNYGNMDVFHPDPIDIWRPRVIVGNTLTDRDLFADDYNPITVIDNGNTTWLPGGLFPVSCKLDLFKYPFDEQQCFIQIISNGLSYEELIFKVSSSSPAIGTQYFVKSGEWTIQSTEIKTFTVSNGLSGFNVVFNLQRLPGFFVINIVIPIIMLSFLNIMVFIIPVDSGEKISYGITVLLALSVFMSVVSDQLPRSSDILPLVTIYLMVLTTISVCSVIVCIGIVFWHHKRENEEKQEKARSNFKEAFRKVNILNRGAVNFTKVSPAFSDMKNDKSNKPASEKMKAIRVLSNMNSNTDPENDDVSIRSGVNKWNFIQENIDYICLVVFLTIWVSVTIGFVTEIAK